MSRRLHLDAEALAELEDAALWYDRQRPGVGDAFVAAVTDAIETLIRWPGFGSPVLDVRGEMLRQAQVDGFPYHVGYVVTDEEIRVLAVAHERRRPGYWTSRR